ncbi:TetR/AcrR family transcriptional regulator [Paenibacillus campi]|uniref:TetR/AcrR family transcriptional regulator n=1 Tax=Paenibacillus campi TaxID=3106031 RepID=UPI002AFF3573|nr:TetR/AcrR family transcriptional regulator [Paenibacillus sp. SGZ-1009]
MAQQTHSLRNIKKARTRIRLYETGLAMMKTHKFNEIMVDEICREAEISKVTFFKCFPQKEALLVYFMRVWLTERILELHTNGKQGFAAVRHVLDSVTECYQHIPGVMPSLIAFLAQIDMHPCMPELSAAEIHLLFPGRETEATVSPNLHALFRDCMMQAQAAGTLAPELKIDDAVKLLCTVFYGAFLTARMYASPDIHGFYELHLARLERH